MQAKINILRQELLLKIFVKRNFLVHSYLPVPLTDGSIFYHLSVNILGNRIIKGSSTGILPKHKLKAKLAKIIRLRQFLHKLLIKSAYF